MNIVKSWGLRLLAAFLILYALFNLVSVIPALKIIPIVFVAVVALAAGVLILIGR